MLSKNDNTSLSQNEINGQKLLNKLKSMGKDYFSSCFRNEN